MRIRRNVAAVIAALTILSPVVAFAGPVSAAPRASSTQPVYETNSRTAVRTGPGQSYRFHTMLQRGTVVRGTGTTHRHYTEILLRGERYWVASRNLEPRREASSSPRPSATASGPTSPKPSSPKPSSPGPRPTQSPTATQAPTATRTPPPTQAPGSWWKPAVGASFQVQYTGTVNLGLDVDVYNLDHEGASKANIDQLRARGVDAICYFNAGAVEDWRADKGRFPASVAGKALDGWPGERWLDIRQLDVLIPIMAARMDACKAKGFVAVDPDNTDGYIQDTGFSITAQHQVAYQRALASEAHKRGLAIGLKNNIEQLDQMASFVDFAVNEQCYEYSECNAYARFLASGKPVFNIEYNAPRAAACASRPAGMSTIFKDLELSAARSVC